MYYPAGSLKARHCVDGARRLYEFCAAFGVPHARCGKIIVAHDEAGIADARSASRPRARPTAWRACAWWTARSSHAREPHVHARRGALLAEHRHPQRRRAGAGAGAAVRRARRRVRAAGLAAARRRRHGRARHACARRPKRLHARSVVNAAGLYADDVSAALGGEPFTHLPVPRRVRGAGAGEAPAGERARLSAAARARGTAWACTSPRPSSATSRWGRRCGFQDRKDDYEDDRIPVERLPGAGARTAARADARRPASGRQRHPSQAALARGVVRRLPHRARPR